MFDFEGDDDFDTLSALRDYEGPGDFATQAPGGAWGARAGLLAGPGAGGYLDAPAASQEVSQTDAARAERDRLAAAEAARVRAENEARWAEEDAAARRAAEEAAAAEAARRAEEERNRQVRVGGTVVVDDRDAGGRLDQTRLVSAEGGETLSPAEAARRSALVSADARAHDAHVANQRRAQAAAQSNPLAALFGGGAGGSPLPGALLSLFGLGGAQSNPISQVLASVLGATDAASQGLQTARATAAQVLGVTLPQLDELQRYVQEQRIQWDATAEHRRLMSEDQFRADALARLWSVEEQLRRLQGSLDMIGPARW